MLSKSIPENSPFFVVLLGFLSALPPLGIDMGLPGLPNMETELQISVAQSTYTLTLFLLGFSLGPVFFGPISDRYGRKPVLLFGIALFSLAAFGCAEASSISVLLFFRILQGVGAGAAAALPAAIVRDIFQGKKALSNQSYVAMINAVTPLIAPLIGAAILAIGDWRSIYHMNAVIGVMLFLVTLWGYHETALLLDQQGKTSSFLSSMIRAYLEILTDKHYILATGVLALTFGSMFSYISSSSAVFMNQFGSSSTVYGLLFAFTAFGEMFGAACNSRLAPNYGTKLILNIAVITSTGISGLLLLLAFSGCHSIHIFAILVISNNICAGMIMPNTTHHALKKLGHIAGSAAALQRSLQMMLGALAGVLIAALKTTPVIAMTSSMLLFALLALILLLFIPKENAHPN